jgi:3,4-dehydroadipyl-CoA semialdehyde dehydrogenase
MQRLQSYLMDQWHTGSGPTSLLVDPSTEAPLAEVQSGGLDFRGALHHARSVGGPTLRAMSFAQRGALLAEMSRALHACREELLDLSQQNNGATRGDAKFDVDGATGTLSAYARLGAALGDRHLLLDGEAEKISSGARFVGMHLRVPRPGVAVHINAFNFPAWGTAEKAAAAILAGMPVISKPATATALVAWRMVDILVRAGVLPAGVLGFVAGRPGDLLDHLEPADVIAFTGSADTGASLRASPAVRERSVRLNVEADSLNAAVLGPDVAPGDDLWNLFVRNVVTDMRQKTGQKCTAIRRVLVPASRADELCAALLAELARIRVGNPADDGVDMGPVATASQLRDARVGIALLAEEADVLCGGAAALDGIGAPAGKGFFVAPTLLRVRDAGRAAKVHQHEVFGPVATVVPIGDSAADAALAVARGQGSLVSSVYSDDGDWMNAFLLGAMPWNGRVMAVNQKVVDQAIPPGMVLPSCIHGGPGRAGGGEELGGHRGLELYTQRVALQGDRAALGRLVGEKV